MLAAKLGNTRKKTFIVALGSILFRYFLLALPLFIGIKFEQINFFSVVTGLFLVQLVILATHLTSHIFSIQKKSRNNI